MRNKSTVKKVSFSIPVRIVDDLDFVSEALGLSRSAFVSALLSQQMPDIVRLCDARGGASDGGRGGKRYRGDSIDSINIMFNQFKIGLREEIQGELFKK